MFNTSKKISHCFLFLFASWFVFLGCKSAQNTLTPSLNQQTENTNQAQPLDSTGVSLQEPENTAIRDSLNNELKNEIFERYQVQANRLTTFYILAQQNFYNGQYQAALVMINRAASIKETADVLALKGSIYYGLGSLEDFITHWTQALDKDRNVPIPPSPPIIAELKKQGLINDNLERNY